MCTQNKNRELRSMKSPISKIEVFANVMFITIQKTVLPITIRVAYTCFF